jgi:hypothetical protein
MERDENSCKILVKKPEWKTPHVRPDADGRTVLKRILKNRMRLWTGFSWQRIELLQL